MQRPAVAAGREFGPETVGLGQRRRGHDVGKRVEARLPRGETRQRLFDNKARRQAAVAIAPSQVRDPGKGGVDQATASCSNSRAHAVMPSRKLLSRRNSLGA